MPSSLPSSLWCVLQDAFDDVVCSHCGRGDNEAARIMLCACSFVLYHAWQFLLSLSLSLSLSLCVCVWILYHAWVVPASLVGVNLLIFTTQQPLRPRELLDPLNDVFMHLTAFFIAGPFDAVCVVHHPSGAYSLLQP